MSTSKGTRLEVPVRDYLQQNLNEDIERMPKYGQADRGDIAGVKAGPYRVTVECKNQATMKLGAWLLEAQQEARNTTKSIGGVVVHKRRGYGQAGDQYVTMSLETFTAILRQTQGER